MENNTFEYVVPCHFGMEAVLKREIMALGYEIVNVADGRVTFRGDEKAIARANIFLRTAERVLLCVGLLMNFLRQRRRFHGEIISRSTENSGSKRLQQPRVSYSAVRTFSQL